MGNYDASSACCQDLTHSAAFEYAVVVGRRSANNSTNPASIEQQLMYSSHVDCNTLFMRPQQSVLHICLYPTLLCLVEGNSLFHENISLRSVVSVRHLVDSLFSILRSVWQAAANVTPEANNAFQVSSLYHAEFV